MTPGFGDEPAGVTGARQLERRVDPQLAIAAGATVAVLRLGGRASLRAIANDLRLPRAQVRKALDLAKREGLIWTRDRNVYASTTKAASLYAGGADQAKQAAA